MLRAPDSAIEGWAQGVRKPILASTDPPRICGRARTDLPGLFPESSSASAQPVLRRVRQPWQAVERRRNGRGRSGLRDALRDASGERAVCGPEVQADSAQAERGD